MPIAWFLCPRVRLRDVPAPRVRTTCVLNDHLARIEADGGAWDGAVVLGGFDLCKVRASDATIAFLSSQPDILYLLGDTPLDTQMALKQQEYNVVNTRLKTQGYSQAEIDAALGSSVSAWNTHTYRDLLNFISSRRLKPRYDSATDTVFWDGVEQPVTPPDVADERIR